jgi:hypothetical protein
MEMQPAPELMLRAATQMPLQLQQQGLRKPFRLTATVHPQGRQRRPLRISHQVTIVWRRLTRHQQQSICPSQKCDRVMRRR